MVTADAELLIDATDAAAAATTRALLGSHGAPQGGLEIIDVTDPTKPVEIGLVSHIGEAHTVNIDPKRPHIAYAVTSDTVAVDATTGQRQNEVPRRRALRPRRLRGGRPVELHGLPPGHAGRRQARRLPARRSTAIATRPPRWPSGTR